METKAHYALVGFFAIALAAAGALFAVWLGQLRFDREFSEYDVVFPGPVRGLTEASEVRFNGIKVGEVTRLSLNRDDASQVIARIRVSAETPVLRDSVAQLEPQGLTGLNYIQITGGTPNGEPLIARAGEVPRLRSRQAQLESLISSSEDIALKADRALAQINKLLSDDNIAEFNAVLRNVRDISDDLNEGQELVVQAREALDRFEQAAADVSSFATETERMLTTDVAEMVNETTLASIEVDRASAEALEILEALNDPMGRFANEGLTDLTLAIGDLRALVQTLDALASELEDDPASFISGGGRSEVEIPQ